MGAPQGIDLQGIQHQLDTLKRVVLLDNYVTIASGTAQSSMATSVLLDLSSLVSATAIAGLFSIFTLPNATAFWTIFVNSNTGVGTTVNLEAFSHDINIWNTNYGIQKLTSSQGVYYRHEMLSGGGNGTFMIRLHGYIDRA